MYNCIENVEFKCGKSGIDFLKIVSVILMKCRDPREKEK